MIDLAIFLERNIDAVSFPLCIFQDSQTSVPSPKSSLIGTKKQILEECILACLFS